MATAALAWYREAGWLERASHELTIIIEDEVVGLLVAVAIHLYYIKGVSNNNSKLWCYIINISFYHYIVIQCKTYDDIDLWYCSYFQMIISWHFKDKHQDPDKPLGLTEWLDQRACSGPFRTLLVHAHDNIPATPRRPSTVVCFPQVQGRVHTPLPPPTE